VFVPWLLVAAYFDPRIKILMWFWSEFTTNYTQVQVINNNN